MIFYVFVKVKKWKSKFNFVVKSSIHGFSGKNFLFRMTFRVGWFGQHRLSWWRQARSSDIFEDKRGRFLIFWKTSIFLGLLLFLIFFGVIRCLGRVHNYYLSVCYIFLLRGLFGKCIQLFFFWYHFWFR